MVKAKEQTLVPDDNYLKSGIHIGIKNKSKFMQEFVYKVRPDGLSIFDVKKINDRLRMISDYLCKFKPEEILVVCKRDNGHKPLKIFGLSTGINTITGRYLPGTLTNPNNEYFIEPKVVVITDTWYDKQVVKDAANSGAVLIALCNTNTVPANIDIVMPCNNRGSKSLGLIYWIIAREYCKKRKKKFDYTVEQFS